MHLTDTHVSYERIESQQSLEGALFTPKLINIPKQHSTTLSFSRVKYVRQGYEHAEPKLQNISYKLNPGWEQYSCSHIVLPMPTQHID